MGGKVWITNTSGQKIYEAYYASNAAFCDSNGPDDCLDEYKLDGVINDLEMRDARIRLEREINQSYFNPITPSKIEEEDSVPTPDGFTMKVTVHMDERYLGNTGWWIFQPEERMEKEVVMSLRWEGGKIRLYQCEPPPYAPPTEEPKSEPKPVAEDSDLVASILTYIFGNGPVALNP